MARPTVADAAAGTNRDGGVEIAVISAPGLWTVQTRFRHRPDVAIIFPAKVLPFAGNYDHASTAG